MRAVAFDPSGLQGLLFDLTLIDTLVRPSKDKTFCQYSLRRETLLKKSDLGVIVKRHAHSKGPAIIKQWNITKTTYVKLSHELWEKNLLKTE